jgi:peptidoglycan/LPS O-acetylase OafA/YrhL
MLHVSSTWFNWSYVLPIMRLPEFIVGVLLAIVARRETRVPTFSPTARELLAIVLVAFAFGISPFIPDALRFAAWTIPAFALLLLVFSEQNGAISRALSAPLLVRLGEISYAFYLIHPMALRIAGVAHAPPALVTIVAFTLALGLSFALFRYIEVPLRRAIKAAASPLPRPVYETL